MNLRKLGHVLLAAAFAAIVSAQDDPFGTSLPPSASGAPPPSAAAPTAGPFDAFVRAVGAMRPMDWLVLVASLVGAWLVGWIIFYFLVRRRSLPSTAAKFGCFWSIAFWFLFLVFVFFAFLVPASLPDVVGWTILALLVVILLILLITRRRS